MYLDIYFYFILQIGLPGGGGEYDVQEGFGWSNGVVLHFLSKHLDLQNDPDIPNNGHNISFSLAFMYKIFYGIIAAKLIMS